jgi:hypothetical protein
MEVGIETVASINGVQQLDSARVFGELCSQSILVSRLGGEIPHSKLRRANVRNVPKHQAGWCNAAGCDF